MRLWIFLIWGALIMSGCKKDDPQILIDEWNAAFEPLKTACGRGDKAACRSACTLSLEHTLCTKVRQASDVNDPQHTAWVEACVRTSLADANNLCAAAELPSPTVAPLTVPVLPEAPDSSLKASPPGGAVLEAAEAAAVQGSLSKEVIRRVVRTHLKEVKSCYERALAAQPNLEGRVKVRFIISGTGQIHSAEIGESTMGSPEVERCIADAVKRWVFPQPKGGGIVTVVYPFVFKTQ